MAQPQGHFGYQIVQIIKTSSLGIGSYGAVYRALCDELPCAAKVIHPMLFQTHDPGAQKIMERFDQECQFMSGVRHPNIVQYLGVSRDPESGMPVLLMELMDSSLTRFLEQSEQPLPFHIQLDLCHDIALALTYLHSNGIIHRDLSSNNVLLIGSGNRAKVTDFGMSKVADANLRMTSMTMCPGTLAYMPPEALDDPPVYTNKLDCFSFGVLDIQILTRQFPEPSQRFITMEIDDPRFPTGQVKVPVPEVQRRQSHIDLVSQTHPLLPVAFDCLKNRERERPSAQELCHRLAALKEAPQYGECVQQAQRVTTDGECVRIGELRAEAQGRQRQLEEKDQIIATKEMQLQEKDRTITTKERQLEKKDRIIATNQRKLQEKDGTIATKERQLQEKDRTIAIKERQLQEKDGTIATKERQLEEKDRIITIRERQLRQLNQQLEANEQVTAEFQQKHIVNEKTNQTLFAAKDQQIKELQQQICDQPTAKLQDRGQSARKGPLRLHWSKCGSAPHEMERLSSVVDMAAIKGGQCAVELKRPEDDSDLNNYAIQPKIDEPWSIENPLLPSPNSLQTPEGARGRRNTIEIVTQFPDIELDSFYDVTVAHVESPDLFYCHFSLHMKQHFTMLMNQLQEVCNADHKKPSKIKCSKGDFVAVQYSGDGLWYRAQVWDASAEEVVVCFVDYGNEEAVSHSKIQYLDPEFAKLPTQAVPCSLAEVSPKKGMDWSDESLEKFVELVFEKQFVAQVKSDAVGTKRFQFGDSQTVSVSLIEEECPMSEELVRLGYANHTSTTAPETELPEEKTHLAEEKTPLAQEKTELADKKSALLQSPGQSLEENILTISVGTEHEVFVTNIESPLCFWLQLASSEEDMNTLAENLEAVYCFANSLTLSDPTVGMQCCAKFSVDQNWYRGIVRSVTPNEMKIQFIDYGNSEVVGPSDVKVLNPEFLDLPVQSIKCKLKDCRPPGCSEWTDEAIASFSRLVLEKPLVAVFVRMSPGGGSWEVTLSEGGTDVSSQLIESGAAVADEASETQVISDLKLKENETYSVYIAVTASPTEFYVQLSSECDKLESLMALVADYYNGNQPPALLEIGRYCVAQYSGNNAWYRAKIVQIESKESVTVHFVDYGNCESVSPTQILALMEEFSLLPAQAACCSVTRDLTQQFSDDKLEEFFSLDFEQEFQIRVSGEQNGRYIVQLMGQDATQISDALLSPDATTPPKVQQSFIPLSFTPGSSVDVYVSHINSPTSFYCQPLELAGEVETMMTKLSQTMKQSPPKQIQDTAAGQACLAHFSADNEWYRAIVKKVMSDGKILVTFVDYGNSEMTTPDHLAVLPDAFLTIRLQAVHCSVFESMDAETKWPLEKVEEFQNQIPESDHFTLTVTGVSEWDQVFVEIATNGETVNFADLLEDHNEKSADVASAAQGPATFRPIPADDQLTNKFANVSIHDTTEISTLAVKGSKTPSTEVETESENGAEGEPLIRAPFKLSLAVCEEFQATMVNVQSPSLLFIQRADCQAELDALSEEIEQYCARFAGKPFQEVFRKGDFVLACYFVDELWYRAEILEVISENTAEVSFIDFGNTETISFEEMTMCPENFLELPVQAIPCSLAQVPHRDSWPPGYKEMIDILVEGRVLKVSVVIPASQGMRSTVTLTDLESGVNIAQSVLDRLQEECEEGVVDDVPMEVPKEDLDGEGISAAQKIVLPERKFDIGHSYDVYLVSCTSPHSFVCQLVCEEDALDSVTTLLAQLYTSDNDLHALVCVPMEGDVVCGQFTGDNQWYRARVLSAEDGECEVLYVDFGKSEIVPAARLRALAPNLSSHPPMAFECFLSGVESPTSDGQFDPLASEKMLELVGEASATLEIHSIDTSGHLGVILTTSHGVDVRASLIEVGLATLFTPHPSTPLTMPSTATSIKHQELTILEPW